MIETRPQSLRRIVLTAVLFSVCWLGIRIAMIPRTGIPVPGIHDEFSYLLGADTLVHGRLSNPPPPLPQFFESPHVLVSPSYASKYPPGQAIFLAIGQKLTGIPFAGVLLSNTVMVFAVSVALLLWCEAPWAYLVILILMADLIPPARWTFSYWGGSVAAAGGAFVLAGIALAPLGRRVSGGIAAGAGLSLLLVSRPAEGAIFAVCLLFAYGRELWQSSRTMLLVSVLAVLPAILFSLFYNNAVTGHPTVLPWALYSRHHDVAPPFWFLPASPEPAYAQPRLAAQHGFGGWEHSYYLSHHLTIKGFAVDAILAGKTLLEQFALTNAPLSAGWHKVIDLIPLIVALPVLLVGRYRRLVLTLAAGFVLLMLETWHFDHYFAPFFTLALIVIAAGAARWSRSGFPANRAGMVLTIAFAVLTFGSSVNSFLDAKPAHNRAEQRSALLEELDRAKTPRLLFVRYPSSNWNVGEEWVYNTADIESQNVIFAHDLGYAADLSLVSHYPHHEPGLLIITERGYRLEALTSRQ